MTLIDQFGQLHDRLVPQGWRDYAVDPAKGKFRTFLVAALKNFLADQHATEQAVKRGGEYRFLPLTPDLVSAEPTAFGAARSANHHPRRCASARPTPSRGGRDHADRPRVLE